MTTHLDNNPLYICPTCIRSKLEKQLDLHMDMIAIIYQDADTDELLQKLTNGAEMSDGNYNLLRIIENADLLIEAYLREEHHVKPQPQSQTDAGT